METNKCKEKGLTSPDELINPVNDELINLAIKFLTLIVPSI